MNTQLFTEKLAKQGKTPTGLRDGTVLDFFKYIPGDAYPFAGVTNDGRALRWNNAGHMNGHKRNMKTDLIYEPMDPDAVRVTLAMTAAKNFYALNKPGEPGQQLHNDYTPFEFVLNTRTGAVSAGKKYPLVVVVKQSIKK
jgi:hypothetical protein